MTKPPPLERVKSSAVMFAAIIFALFSLMGVNGSLQSLETRVYQLDLRVQQLSNVESHIAELREDVTEIGRLRNDILEAIKAASSDDRPRPSAR